MIDYQTVIIFFILASVIFYAILGGADFGAGILEGFTPKRYREQLVNLTGKAMGPVWEANHIWLILCVVIIFTAYPEVFSLISIRFHLPITLMLIGIVFRGCSFTFRHYDVNSESYSKIYSKIFFLSSLISVLFQGVIVGAMILGRINTHDSTFYEIYLKSWLNPFCFMVGIFLCSLTSLLATVFLVTESAEHPELLEHLIIKTKKQLTLLVILGLIVFVTGELSGVALATRFISSKTSVCSLMIATLCLPLLLYSISNLTLNLKEIERQIYLWITRFTAGLLVASIVAGLFFIQFPIIVSINSGLNHSSHLEGLSLLDNIASEPTQRALVIALIGGGIFIFPSLIYLFKVFKKS
jgi:cytochrome bd ubiquinol oxidase subunit II